MMQAFLEAEAYINNIPKFVKKNTMQDTKDFYRKLSYPGIHSKVIHVAGTNGKGSVCAYLQSVLMEAGYRVGMFTSPHLVDIRERIRVNGELIPEADFAEAFAQVRDHCIVNSEQTVKGGDLPEDGNKWNCHLQGRCGITENVNMREDYHPSYFEYLYFMAMLCFEKEQPDFIILETGMGGRLDATNSFPSPCISIITEIGLDHTEYLGETLEEIAAEKAGIVKKGIPVVYFAKNKIISGVIEKSAKKADSKAFSVKSEEINLKNCDEKGIDFSYYSGYYKYSAFHLSTKALYQTENAALCIRALAVLKVQGTLEVSERDLRKGLERSRWEGRMEEILPGIYLDGAHNPDGIAAFLESVRADGAEESRILLYSSLAEKACGEMVRQITAAELFKEIIVTRIGGSRAAAAKELAGLFGGKKVAVIEDMEEAFRYCLHKKRAGEKVYITGSLYLAGQVLGMLKAGKMRCFIQKDFC